MIHASANDPMAKTTGMMPRYMVQRQAMANRERIQAAVAETQAADFADDDSVYEARPIDAVTTEMRYRLQAVAQQPRRSKFVVAGPALAGLSVLLWHLVNTIANGMPVAPHMPL